MRKIYRVKLIDFSGGTLETAETIHCIACKEFLSGSGGGGIFICEECLGAISLPLNLGPRPLHPSELEEYGLSL
jgi:hypothetical protein